MPISATTDDTLMMRPQRALSIGRATARHTLQVPRRLVATTSSKSSGFMRRISWSRVMPALLTAIPIGPRDWLTFATAASTASPSATSQHSATARPPSSSMALTVSAAPSAPER